MILPFFHHYVIARLELPKRSHNWRLALDMSHQSLNLSPAKKIVNKQTNNACKSLQICKCYQLVQMQKTWKNTIVHVAKNWYRNSRNSEKVCESSWKIQFRWQPLLFLDYDMIYLSKALGDRLVQNTEVKKKCSKKSSTPFLLFMIGYKIKSFFSNAFPLK